MTANAAHHFDLIVIGSGSAASACWFHARRLGKRVAVFEGETLGGECASFACVPTKALLHCAEVYETVASASRFGVEAGPVAVDYPLVKAWKDHVVSQTGAALGEQPYVEGGVTLVRHHARFVSPSEVEAGGKRYSAGRFLIATGSRQVIPPIPGLAEAGYITFREAIDLTSVPGSLLIIGGGAVGCEFTRLLTTFGAQVTLVDRNPRLLHREDPEVGDFIGAHFGTQGVRLRLGAAVERIDAPAGRKRVVLRAAGREEALLVDEVLVATGKTPNVDIGLEAAGIAYTADGVTVDATLRTTNPIVYAAGDVAGPHRFTHAASYQGRLACDNMFSGRSREVAYTAMPRCVFTSPEVGTVGLTEREAREQSIAVRIGRADIADNDRALTSGRSEGFVKVVADASGRLLGGAIIAARAAEVAQELALAVSLGATAAQVAATIHAFPTYSEALAAACEEVG